MRVGVKTGRGGKLPGETMNKAGGVAFTVADPSERMLHLVGALFNEPTYYPDDADRGDAAELTSEARAFVDTVAEILNGPTPEDAFAIARWARTDGNLRTTPIVALAVGAEDPKAPEKKRRHGALVRRYASSILQRADEPRNVVAAWLHLYGRENGRRAKIVPKALARAVRDLLAVLPEHALAKWDGTGRPSLGDVVRLCARDRLSLPKLLYFVDRAKWRPLSDATPVLRDRAILFEKTEFDEAARVLAQAARVTWEDVTSRFGSKPEIWAWAASRMPYMALLRNLRNLVDAEIPDAAMLAALAKIADPEEVRKSRQFPFRFLSAARVFGDPSGRAVKEIRQAKPSRWTQPALDALDGAAKAACDELPDLPGVTAIFLDDSGSMSSPVSAQSSLSLVDAAAMLASVLAYCSDDVRIFAFSNDVRAAHYRRGDSLLTNMSRMVSPQGGATNAFLCPAMLERCGIVPSRVILVSDMQCWDSGGYGNSLRDQWVRYKAGRAIPFYSINLAGTAEAQMASTDNDVHLLSGFSEKLVNVIAGAEAAPEEGPAPRAAVPTLDVIRRDWYLK